MNRKIGGDDITIISYALKDEQIVGGPGSRTR